MGGDARADSGVDNGGSEPALVDRWISIPVAADGALALFFHVSDTDRPLPVALRPLGAAGRRTMETEKRVKVWLVAEPTPFAAVIVNVYVPAVVGAPEIVAVPSPLSVNKTPDGRLPDVTDKPGVGNPVDLTLKAQASPTRHVAWSALVILGRLEDGEGEGLGVGRTDTVRGGDRDQVHAAGGRCSRQCRRAVLVVRERDSRRQCARLSKCARGRPGRRDGKGSRPGRR